MQFLCVDHRFCDFRLLFNSNRRYAFISDDHNLFYEDPLAVVYRDMSGRGGGSYTSASLSSYPVYTPKSSSEYFSVRNSQPNPHLTPSTYRVSKRASERAASRKTSARHSDARYFRPPRAVASARRKHAIARVARNFFVRKKKKKLNAIRTRRNSLRAVCRSLKNAR